MPRWLKKLWQYEPALPYRKIMERHGVVDGEIVSLECGHVVHLVQHKIQEIHCPDCARKREEKP